MKVPSWRPRRSPHRSRTMAGRAAGVTMPAADGVLEVVAHVGDPVGPAHHLALGGRRRRPGPGVVADAVERLLAQVERRAATTSAPHDGVVEAAVDVGGEGVLAGVAARAVAAVVAEGDGLGEGHVEPAGPGDAGGHLGDLEGVGQPGPLVVVGEDEDLGLAGQAPEGAASAGCGRGRARSRCATGRAPRPGHGRPHPGRGWPRGRAGSPRAPRGRPGRNRGRACRSRWWRDCPGGRT